MINKKIVRALWTLADRLDHASSIARNANLPHELNYSKRLLLRHIGRLNKIRDYWADHHVRTRKFKYAPPPCCPCQEPPVHWATRARFHGFRKGHSQ